MLIVGALLAATRNKVLHWYASRNARLAVIAIGPVCKKPTAPKSRIDEIAVHIAMHEMGWRRNL